MNHLPGILSIIAQVAGRDAALAIAAKHGGTELSIPLEPPISHWLCREIGRNAARQVAKRIAQEHGVVAPIPFAPVELPYDTRFDSSALNLISDVIGPAATLTLAEHFRGIRLFIPKNPEKSPRLVTAIGMELAQKLCDVHYSTTSYIAIGECLKYRVAQLWEAGLTKSEIAQRLKITERRAFRVWQGVRDDPVANRLAPAALPG